MSLLFRVFTHKEPREILTHDLSPPFLMCSKNPLCTVGYVLMAVGAINWGLVAALNFNLVEALLGTWPVVTKIVYILVGLSGLAGLVCMAKCGGKCGCVGGSCSCSSPQ